MQYSILTTSFQIARATEVRGLHSGDVATYTKVRGWLRVMDSED